VAPSISRPPRIANPFAKTKPRTRLQRLRDVSRRLNGLRASPALLRPGIPKLSHRTVKLDGIGRQITMRPQMRQLRRTIVRALASYAWYRGKAGQARFRALRARLGRSLVQSKGPAPVKGKSALRGPKKLSNAFKTVWCRAVSGALATTQAIAPPLRSRRVELRAQRVQERPTRSWRSLYAGPIRHVRSGYGRDFPSRPRARLREGRDRFHEVHNKVGEAGGNGRELRRSLDK